ncbi:MAG: acetyl-CoA carboxylase biotin carboxyl carrier protein [Candidatus Velthaea sp.]
MFEETIASRIRPLAEAFHATELTRLSVSEDGFELELRRAARPPAGSAALTPPAAASAPSESGAAKPEVIAADVVGVVRLLRPQIAEGQQVGSDRDLAFVEALGIRNPVRSRGAGRVAAVFVTDGQPVEYGQPLFALERV